MPAVRAIIRETAAEDYRFSAIVLGVVKSTPFTMSVQLPPEADPGATTAAVR
jgi:hypothetical protein